MDIICKNCGEPWDLYFLGHEEKIFKDPKEIERGMYESGDFVYKPYLGFDEAYEGHFHLLYCPACRRSKYQVSKRTKEKLKEPSDPQTELARQVVAESKDIPDFGYWGDVPLGETWGFTFNQSRDSDALARSNWEVISADMQERFPDDVEIVRSSHWAVGWVDQLAVRMLDKYGEITPAGKAALKWRDELADYPVADEEHYSQTEYDEFVEWLKYEVGEEHLDAALEWVGDGDLPYNTEDWRNEDYEDLKEYIKSIELEKWLAKEFGEKNVEAAMKWIDDNEMVYDIDEWDDAELDELYRYMGGKRPYTEAEERALGQKFMYNPRRKRGRRR